MEINSPGGGDVRPWIVLGDRTDHGGVVITALDNTTTDGQRVARIGDLVSCPIPGHGVNPIVSGSRVLTLDGRYVARHGDKSSCGSSLLASQFVTASE